jgi:hypothetical protein
MSRVIPPLVAILPGDGRVPEVYVQRAGLAERSSDVESLNPVTPTNVPDTGLSSIDEVPAMVDLAAVFFGNVLSVTYQDGDDIRLGIEPESLEQSDPSDIPDLSSDLADGE